jgi:hypothetical protein
MPTTSFGLGVDCEDVDFFCADALRASSRSAACSTYRRFIFLKCMYSNIAIENQNAIDYNKTSSGTR